MAQQQPTPATPGTNGSARKAALPAVRIARHGETLDLSVYDPQQFHLLVPFQAIQPSSPYLMVSANVVRLSPNPDDGDVYKGEGGSVRLTKVGLMKLASGAGITWHWPECKRVDDGSNRDYVCWTVVGGLMLPDGTYQVVRATKEIDLEVIEAEVREQQAKKIDYEWDEQARQYIKRNWKSQESRDAALEDAVRKEMIRYRKNRLALAETGAYLRAIRQALSIKANYKPAELAKPFVMVRTWIDVSQDPELARQRMLGAGPGFGLTVQQPHSESPAVAVLAAPRVVERPEAPDEADEPSEVYNGEIPEEETVTADRLI